MKSLFTYIVALAFGSLFSLLHIPLAWILGPVVGLFLYKLLAQRETSQWPFLRNIAYLVLGVQIGLTFTSNTFSLIFPYFVPYTVLSLTMIVFSMVAAYWIAKRTSLDSTTSLIGAAPGGLSAMIAVSDSFKGKTVLVTIFHTLRLLAVLFIVPFVATHCFTATSEDVSSVQRGSNGPIWTLLLYALLFIASYKARNFIPASLVIIPMLVIGGLQTFGFPMYQWPGFVFIGAQVIIGVHLGHSVTMDDVKAAGRYCFYFAGLSISLIGLGYVLGVVLSSWTGMGTLTALLALAPGGLVEMALTAKQTGGDPSIVSSLQTIRLLTIVLLLPVVFKWLLPKLK